MKKVVSGRPALACGRATARTGPPDTTFFISRPDEPGPPPSFRSGRRVGERSSAPRRESSAEPLVLPCRVSLRIYDEINDESTAD